MFIDVVFVFGGKHTSAIHDPAPYVQWISYHWTFAGSDVLKTIHKNISAPKMHKVMLFVFFLFFSFCCCSFCLMKLSYSTARATKVSFYFDTSSMNGNHLQFVDWCAHMRGPFCWARQRLCCDCICEFGCMNGVCVCGTVVSIVSIDKSIYNPCVDSVNIVMFANSNHIECTSDVQWLFKWNLMEYRIVWIYSTRFFLSTYKIS